MIIKYIDETWEQEQNKLSFSFTAVKKRTYGLKWQVKDI